METTGHLETEQLDQADEQTQRPLGQASFNAHFFEGEYGTRQSYDSSDDQRPDDN